MKNNTILALTIVVIFITVVTLGILFYIKTHGSKKHKDGKSSDKSHDKSILSEYFSRLFPVGDWSKVSEKDMEKLYLNLDSWYTKMIPKYEQKIISKQPQWNENRMNLWNQKAGTWEKLFDGSLCDCMRFAFPNCVSPSSRFGGRNILKDCPLWPGLNVGKTQETVLTQAFNTNNKDSNFLVDSSTKNGKGFPNHSWFEGLAYPGEYGHPVICGEIPNDLKAPQPGVQFLNPDTGKWGKVDKPFSEGPWYNSQCKKGKCPVDFLKCVQAKNDGQFPKKQHLKGEYCFIPDDLNIKENYEGHIPRSLAMHKLWADENTTFYDEELDEELDDELDDDLSFRYTKPTYVRKIDFDDCSNYPNTPCKKPDADNFHGMWLYPLRGVGMWRNIGNSVVCNTKLGYLITPSENPNGGTPLGAGYKIEDMLALVGKFGGGPQNINLQLKRLIQIIQKGYVKRTRSYSSKSLNDLQKHGYTGGKQTNYYKAKQAALELMEKWYKEGYTGIGSEEAPNGFNYNYQEHFPLGTQFGYAAAFDNLVLATMVKDKVDTLQLIAEPQAAKAGLRPAYIFEIFQCTPTKKTKNGDWCIFKDTSPAQCKEFYMINPMDDFDNYTKYGYVSGAKVKNQEIFDPSKMILSAVEPLFNPDIN